MIMGPGFEVKSYALAERGGSMVTVTAAVVVLPAPSSIVYVKVSTPV